MIHLLLAAAIAWSPVSGRKAGPDPDPAACAAEGGKVVRACFSQFPMCVIPYADAGKPCTDKSECRGECRYEGLDQPQGQVVGACQRDNYPCGCRRTITKGRITGGFCGD